MAQEDNNKIVPFPGSKYISLIEAASYIKSFVRADVLKVLQNLKDNSDGKTVPIEHINRLIELYITH